MSETVTVKLGADTSSVIQALDEVTAAVDRLEAALERVKELGIRISVAVEEDAP